MAPKSCSEHLDLAAHQHQQHSRWLSTSLDSYQPPLIEEDIEDLKDNIMRVEHTEQKNILELRNLREAKFHLRNQLQQDLQRLNSREDRIQVGMTKMLKNFQQHLAEVTASTAKIQEQQQKLWAQVYNSAAKIQENQQRLLALVEEFTPQLEAFQEIENREKARDKLRRDFLKEKLQDLERGPTNMDHDLMEAISKMDQKRPPVRKQAAKTKAKGKKATKTGPKAKKGAKKVAKKGAKKGTNTKKGAKK